MDPRISLHYVTLDPNNIHEWRLCQLVVDYTHEYLGRDVLLEIDQALGPRPICHSWAKAQRDYLIMQLSAYVAHIEQRYANLKLLIHFKAAWMDWNARQSAFAGTSVEIHPVYLAALTELVRDLRNPPHLPNFETEDYGLACVAILAS